MSYVNMHFCAPNFLKSQETSFIYSHLNSCGGQAGADRRARCLEQWYLLRGLREGVERRRCFGKVKGYKRFVIRLFDGGDDIELETGGILHL